MKKIASLGVATVTCQGREQDSGQWIASYVLRLPWAEYRIPQGQIAFHPLEQKRLEKFTEALLQATYA